MSTTRMPGRHGEPRADSRNCYMTDEEIAQCAQAADLWRQAEGEHNLPVMVWYVLVAIASVGCFFAGLLLGQGS